jgi:hypothetical protein
MVSAVIARQSERDVSPHSHTMNAPLKFAMLTGTPISELPRTEASLFLVVGTVFLAIGLFRKKFVYLVAPKTGEPAPLWLGRIMFSCIGVLFFIVGAYNLWLR